jgi:glycerol-3-phosphate dehydrogenase (NAD(P)+)
MYNITVLGAGYMGSAITFPLSRDNNVKLWGTWLDDGIIEECLGGKHPKLKEPLPSSVDLFYSNELEAALKDTDIVFVGISSEGFLSVFKKLLEVLDHNIYIYTLTKGFVDDNGMIKRTSIAAKELLDDRFPGDPFLWTSIGGPVKALEICRSVPTVSVYAASSSKMTDLAAGFSTDYYRIIHTDDITGVEISADFKNVYATGMGIIDGLYGPEMAGNYHNFSSLIFNQSILEISKIVEAEGGKKITVFDNAGIGDLYTTSQSGRNRKFGELIGSGKPPEQVYTEMLEDGELAEGYHTLKLGMSWLEDNHKKLLDRLPLFNIIHRIIFEEKDPLKELAGLLQRL